MAGPPDEAEGIDCEEHGRGSPTYVCRHLTPHGKGRGFVMGYDEEQPDDLWPDAWCAACEERREGEGEAVEAFAEPRLVCDQCYEGIRARHWREPPGLDDLVHVAVHELQDLQEKLRERFALDSWPRYEWNQGQGEIGFFDDRGRLAVSADIQFVGSVAPRAGTWLWSWANSSHEATLKREVREVRRFGDERGYLRLRAARWPATEQDGWEMTALSAHLTGAEGAYRSPGDHGVALFMLLWNVRRAQ